MALPINIDDLLSKQKVESNRIEFKAGWNPASIFGKSAKELPRKLALSWIRSAIPSQRTNERHSTAAFLPSAEVLRLLLKIAKNTREALMKSARADGERFWFQARFGK